jgi:hypothetical protein
MSKIFKNDLGKKFLFFTNYKVMNSYLTNILKTNFPGIVVYISIEKIHVFDGYIKLTIVRDPYDRLVSLFFDKCRKHPKDVRNLTNQIYLQTNQAQLLAAYAKIANKEIEIVEPGEEIEMNTTLYDKFLANLELLESISFPEFLEIVAFLFASPSMDAHFFPQSKIMMRNNELVVDRFYKLENIKESWDEICSLLGVNLDLTYGVNRTNYEGPDEYKRFYTDEMKKKVYDLYRIDFENFEYAE